MRRTGTWYVESCSHKGFGDLAGRAPAVLGLNLTPVEAIALIGRNGAGKTSLLRAVAGLLRADAGEIGFEALDAETARAEHLHMVGHHDGLKSTRTAWEELRFQTLWTGGTEASARVAAERFDLNRLLDLEVRRLSAGQRRRLGPGPAGRRAAGCGCWTSRWPRWTAGRRERYRRA